MTNRPRGNGAVVSVIWRGRTGLGTRRLRSILEALNAHQHGAAAALLGLLVLSYLWPALIEGHALTGTAVAFSVAPWHHAAPAGFLRYANSALGDVALSYYPWDVLARRLIHAGTFPAWSPHAFAGTPFFANPEVAWLSPFSLPLWLLPLNYGLGVAAALKLWTAGFGTYLLARELRLGFWPAIVAAVSFALCAFNVVWLSYGVQVSVAALLPWLLWSAERILRRGRAIDGLALAGLTAWAMTGGHPGTQLHVLAAVVLYAAVRAALSRGLPAVLRLRRLATVGGTLLLGIALAAVVLVPATRAAAGTAGAAARAHGAAEFEGFLMSPRVLRTALFPDWWGRPSEHVVRGPVNYRERTFYAGAVSLVLAWIALLDRRGWRRKAPFALLGVLGAAIAVRAPVIRSLVDHLPLFGQVQNQRILLWFQLMVAVLAAFGLDALLTASRPQRRVWIVLGAAAAVALLALASVTVNGRTLREAARHLAQRPGPHMTPSGMALVSIATFAIFVGGLAAILLLARRRPERRRAVGVLVALLVTADMLHFAHGYQPMGPAAQVVPKATPAIAFLRRHASDGRVAGRRYILMPGWAGIFGLRDARGYDAPQPSMRFLALWRAMEASQPPASPYLVRDFTPVALRVLGLLGARYLIDAPGVRSHQRWLRPVYRGGDATIFANALAMPRALVPSRIRRAQDEDAEIEAVAGAFDPRRDAVVRSDRLGGVPFPSAGSGSARVVEEQNARVTLRVRLRRRGLVLLDDAWAPGWSVRVDGRPARALQADVVLRGVVAPAGAHEIVWSYRVPGLRLGAALSGAALLVLLGWAAGLILRRRPRRAPARRRRGAPTGGAGAARRGSRASPASG